MPEQTRLEAAQYIADVLHGRLELIQPYCKRLYLWAFEEMNPLALPTAGYNKLALAHLKANPTLNVAWYPASLDLLVIDVDNPNRANGFLDGLRLDFSSVPMVATPRGVHYYFHSNTKFPKALGGDGFDVLAGMATYTLLPGSSQGESEAFSWLYHNISLIKWGEITQFPEVPPALLEHIQRMQEQDNVPDSLFDFDDDGNGDRDW